MDAIDTWTGLRTGCRVVATGVARSITAMLEVRLLGPVEVVRDGVVTRLTPTQQLIIAVLAASHPEPIPPSRMIDAIWGEQPPRSAMTSLRAQISRIRRAIGDDGVVTEGGRYRLGEHHNDVMDLERALRAGDPEALDRARKRLRGRPLDDLRSELIDAERRRLEELVSQLEDRHAESLLTRGAYSDAAARFRDLVSQDPLREQRWRGLAEALAGSGRVPEAVRALRRCRDAFADVGLETSPALESLEDVLVGGALPDRSFPSGPELVGRQQDIRRVSELMDVARLVTLVGPPGVGKTALARNIAPHMVWCDLSSIADDGDVATAVCRAVDAPLVAPYTESLTSFFAMRPMAVVLDNCEQVIDGVAALVSELLTTSADVKLLATSREPLRVAAERVHRVRPLDVESTGAELFRQRLGELGVESRGPDAADVERLCRMLDGLPLAIEMAASQAAFVGFGPTLQMVDRATSQLRSDRRDGDDRHRSLAALVDSSLDLLSPAAHDLLGLLSAFVDDFEPSAAHEVGGTSDESQTVALLADLSRRSLLEMSPGGRFRMLLTIRHRVTERMGSDHADAVRAHARYQVDVAGDLAAVPFGPDERTRFDRMDHLVGEFRAATFRSAEMRDFQAPARISAALFQYAYTRIRADVAEWGERLLALPEFVRQPGACDVLLLAALASMHRSELGIARKRCERAVDLAGSDLARAFTIHLLAEVRGYAGERQAMLELSEEPIRIAERHDHPLLVALGLQNQVLADAYQGRRDAALRRMPRLREAADALDSDIQRGWASFCEGEVLIENDPNTSLDLLEDAVWKAQIGGADFLEGVATASLASLRARHGDPASAFETFASSIRRFRDRGNWVHQRVVIRNFAVLLAHVGRHADAAVLLSALRDDVAAVEGPERGRLDAAWETAINTDQGREAAPRGLRLRPAEIVDHALGMAEN